MTERGFDSGYWSHTFVQKLPLEAKALYVYLWTNNHCNQAGLYEITPATIAFETKLDEEAIPELMRVLEPKVQWWPEYNLVWVKNFIKRQAKSPKFLQAAAKSLTVINVNGPISELLRYNSERHSISIPYQYYIDRVSILARVTASASDTVSNSKAGIPRGGEGEAGAEKFSEKIPGGNATPVSESEIEKSLSPGDQEVISTWRSVRGFNMSLSDASELVAKLRTEFPDVDILAESKKWAARKLSEPFTKKSRPSAQIWNFMCKAREFAGERRQNGKQKTERRRAIKYISGSGSGTAGPESGKDLS